MIVVATVYLTTNIPCKLNRLRVYNSVLPQDKVIRIRYLNATERGDTHVQEHAVENRHWNELQQHRSAVNSTMDIILESQTQR